MTSSPVNKISTGAVPCSPSPRAPLSFALLPRFLPRPAPPCLPVRAFPGLLHRPPRPRNPGAISASPTPIHRPDRVREIKRGASLQRPRNAGPRCNRAGGRLAGSARRPRPQPPCHRHLRAALQPQGKSGVPSARPCAAPLTLATDIVHAAPLCFPGRWIARCRRGVRHRRCVRVEVPAPPQACSQAAPAYPCSGPRRDCA